MLDKTNLFELMQNELDELLIKTNSLEDIIYLTTSKKLSKHASIFYDYQSAFVNACWRGDLETVKFFLTSSLLSEHCDIHNHTHGTDAAFTFACAAGHLDVVQYLLTSPDLKKHSDPYANEHEGLIFAYTNNHHHVVDYLLSIPDIYTPNFLANHQQLFHSLCEYGHVQLLEQFIFSPEKYGSIDFIKDNYGWQTAVSNRQLDMLNYLYTIPAIKNNISLSLENSGLLQITELSYLSPACDSNQLFKFLNSLPEIQHLLKQKHNIKELLMAMCKDEELDITHQLLTDYDYKITPEFLNNDQIPHTLKPILNAYYLQQKLNEELEKSSLPLKKIKI